MEKPTSENSFRCGYCKKAIKPGAGFGSSHRNHCPHCGYSLHVDQARGDRKSNCGGLMKPVGLIFKAHEEICLVHVCLVCDKVNFNRIAADDDTEMILSTLRNSYHLEPDLKNLLSSKKISLIGPEDENKILIQMYGIPSGK